jgi:hypothetical protein
MASRAIQPSWQAVIPAAKRSAHLRAAGCADAATLNHWVTWPRRITTYPTTATPKSRSSKARGIPAAKISAPVICTNTMRR